MLRRERSLADRTVRGFGHSQDLDLCLDLGQHCFLCGLVLGQHGDLLGEFLKKEAPETSYKYVALDRAGKDFTPAVLPLRANPPELVVNIMLPPAAYILMNQLYEQGVAPSAKTAFYDGAGIADYPDFWQNVKEAGKYMLAFGLYHPAMPMPDLGKQVGETYQKNSGNEPNRLIFQAADSVLLIARAIEKAGSTDGEAILWHDRGAARLHACEQIGPERSPPLAFNEILPDAKI